MSQRFAGCPRALRHSATCGHLRKHSSILAMIGLATLLAAGTMTAADTSGQDLYVDSADPGQGSSVPGETVVYPGSVYAVTGDATFDNAYFGYNGGGAITQTDGNLTINNRLYFGYNASAVGTYTLSGGTLSLGFIPVIGYYGQGTFTQTGGVFTTNGHVFYLGYNVGSNGTYNLSGGSLSVGPAFVGGLGMGKFVQTGGSFTTDGLEVAGDYSIGFGSYSLSGTGNLSANGASVGSTGNGAFTQDGGRFTTNGNGLLVGGSITVGNYLLSSGNLFTGTTYISNGGSADTFVQSGGLHFTDVVQFDASASTYSLNGGTLKTAKIFGYKVVYMTYKVSDSKRVNTTPTYPVEVPGAGTFNFNGGTLQVSGDTQYQVPPDLAGFFVGINQVNVRNGGAIIDTQTYNVTANQVLSHSAIAGDAAIDGGLTKLGTGTLTLAAPDTYTGPTAVSAGTLLVTMNGGLGSSDVNVADGAALSLGSAVNDAHNAFIGTTLHLAASATSVVNLSGSGVQDTVKALIINGVAQPAGTYGAPGSGATYTNVANFTGTGQLRVAPDGVTHLAFFGGETVLNNGAYYLKFPDGRSFGYYSYLADPKYLYHFDLGYEYVFNAADGKNGVYLYDFESGGFFYASPGFPFPYLYDFTLNTVLYYYPDPNNPDRYNTNGVRYFYRFDTGQIISK